MYFHTLHNDSEQCGYARGTAPKVAVYTDRAARDFIADDLKNQDEIEGLFGKSGTTGFYLSV